VGSATRRRGRDVRQRVPVIRCATSSPIPAGTFRHPPSLATWRLAYNFGRSICRGWVPLSTPRSQLPRSASGRTERRPRRLSSSRAERRPRRRGTPPALYAACRMTTTRRASRSPAPSLKGLGLPLILVHVVTSGAIPPLAFGAQSETIAPITGGTVNHRAADPETLDRVARAAGLRRLDTAGFRLVRGTPGPTLAATARREQASLIVVRRSKRGRLQQALLGSVAGYLLRRCERPVVVCPRDPAAAMRVRAALTPLPDPRARRW
jgi:nucleotide-binding universal stress UspA family protein